MGEAIKRAKENDPKELKAEVARLRRELATEQARVEVRTETVTQIEYVDRPVISESDRALLEALHRSLQENVSIAEGAAATLKNVADDFLSVANKLSDAAHPDEPREPAKVIPIRSPEKPKPYVPPAMDAAVKKVAADFKDQILTYELGTQERTVLGVLAQYPDGRSKQQVAMLSGYSQTSGAFGQALANLKKLSLIDGSSALFKITDKGRDEIGTDYDPLPTGEELRQYWIDKRPAQEGKILKALIDVYPNTLSKREIAEQVGYSETSGAFGQALANLKKLDIISGGSAAFLASDALFQ